MCTAQEYRLIAGSHAINGRVVQPGESRIGYVSDQPYLVTTNGAEPISADLARAYEEDARRREFARAVDKVQGWSN